MSSYALPYHRVVCVACYFWERIGEPEPGNQMEGLCRRRAPVATASDVEIPDRRMTRHWPVTYEEDWCADGMSVFDDEDMIDGMGRKRTPKAPDASLLRR